MIDQSVIRDLRPMLEPLEPVPDYVVGIAERSFTGAATRERRVYNVAHASGTVVS
jgi:hypothetical protein